MVSRLAALPLAPLCGLPMPCSERTPAAGRPAAARGATLHFHDVDMTLQSAPPAAAPAGRLAGCGAGGLRLPGILTARTVVAYISVAYVITETHCTLWRPQRTHCAACSI